MPRSRELMLQAMRLHEPARVPVMCQLAIGHTLLQTGVDPVDFFLSSEAYAGALLTMRERYRFDGVLLHKPGRDAAFLDLATRVDREGPVPTIRLTDGAAIECRRDDDPYYIPAEGFRRPAEAREVDPDNPLGWAPESYTRWCAHKGTLVARSADDLPTHWFGAIDRVRAELGDEYSIHGEVRAPLDHLAAVLGLPETMMALLVEPECVRPVLETFTRTSEVWAVAQVERGCDAIKISSPYAGAGFISREMYRDWVVSYEGRVAAAVRAAGAIVYTHTCGAIGDRLDLMIECGIHGLEALDPPPLGTVDLATAKRQLRDKLFIKGNVNPVTLLKADRTTARAEIQSALAIGRAGGQYILSTACSVAPHTPAENVRQLAECACAAAEEHTP